MVVPSCTVSVSKTVLPTSAVSMCSQYVSDAVVQSAGRVTVWVRVSVWAEPYPSSQANRVPPWALCPLKAPMTPEVAVHGRGAGLEAGVADQLGRHARCRGRRRGAGHHRHGRTEGECGSRGNDPLSDRHVVLL